MATGQDLRHDFAPAWLKLPNSETVKQHAVKFGERSLDRSVNERSGRAAWYSSSSSGSSSGSRGRSAIDDVSCIQQQPRRQRFYSSDHPTEYNGSFTGDGQRSHVRHGGNSGGRFHDQVNGGTGTETSVPYSGTGSRSPVAVNGSFSRAKYHADGRSGSMPETLRGQSQRAKAVRESDNVVTSLDDEFPSLNGESHVENKKPVVNKVQSVWGSPCRDPTSVGSRVTIGSADTSHKALVLKTGGLTKRGGTGVTDADRNAGRSLVSASAQKLASMPKESVVAGNSLSSFLVKQPKNLVDKKSSFLKALRRESQESPHHNLINGEARQQMASPTSPSATENGDIKMLSAEAVSDTRENTGNSAESLETDNVHEVGEEDEEENDSASGDVFHPGFTEAEYRLLLEMGWKEQDEDEDGYEITEDDVREFENLCRQLKINKSNHPSLTSHRNGFSKTAASLIAPAGLRLSSGSFMADVSLPYLEPSDAADDEDDSSSDTSDGNANNVNPHL